MRSIIVFAGLVLGVSGILGSYLDRGQPKPVKPAVTPVAAVATSPQSAASGRRSVTINRDSRGHFQAAGRIDGRSVDFMVDTGASVIALTERDAGRLGIRPVRNDYTAQVRTANGMVNAAPVTLNAVDIGGLVVRDVQALVIPGDALGENLLGLSYLTKLKRFEYSNGRLVLEQ
jgi:aspartyl protease family protein